jgi:biopolymer transport protein ExbD
MEFERRKRGRNYLDVAPLVDVVFNLLLFFVITYNVAADPAIRIRLPESATADAAAAEPLVITLNSGGGIHLGEQPVAMADISELLRLRLAAAAESSVRIRADQEVGVGLLVQVIDEVKRSGCSAFSLVTERKPGT